MIRESVFPVALQVVGEKLERMGREQAKREKDQVPPRPAAALPMENPYCSCELTRCGGQAAKATLLEARLAEAAAKEGEARRLLAEAEAQVPPTLTRLPIRMDAVPPSPPAELCPEFAVWTTRRPPGWRSGRRRRRPAGRRPTPTRR